ncbi:hypothetical protein BH24ACT5_BH24ACT5_18820 [soil metagenome]
MPHTDGSPLHLQQAADELGVHYQTAYRWVRSGRLPAVLTCGQYVVDRAAVAAVNAARRTPRFPPPPGPPRWERAASRMYDALTTGDESAAVTICRRLVDDRASVVDLIQTVLVPPLLQIGDDWRAGELTVWVEHRASGIIDRLLGTLTPNPRGRRRGTAVVAALSGDHHSLPTAMAAAALRDDNWHVEHLGADLPPDQLTQFCERHGPGVVALSVTNPATTGLAAATADALRNAGTPTIVGAPGRTLTELIDLARTQHRPSA